MVKRCISMIWRNYRISILNFTEYPTSVIPLLLAWLIFDITQFYMINIVFEEFQPFPQWDSEEVAFLYGFALLSEGLETLFFSASSEISNLIISGRLDSLLVKPIPVIVQFLFGGINIVAISDLFASGLISIYSITKLKMNIQFEFIISLLIVVVFATLLRTGLFLLLNSVSFWTQKASSLRSVGYFLTNNVAKYPISILPKIFRGIFTGIVPIAFIAYFPVSVLFGKVPRVFIIISISVSLGIFSIAIIVFNLGLKKYESAGS